MRVIVAPDSFTETLASGAAAAAIAEGWARAAPQDEVDLVPMSDGGPGFVAALAGSVAGGRLVAVATRDPLLRPALGQLLIAGDTAYVESAQACGLHLLAPSERDPRRTSTAGVGDLVRAAVDLGVGRVVVGLGGSGTNDGGSGMLQALGVALLDVKGDPLPPGGGALARLERLVPPAPWPTAAVEITAATDVDSPLLGPDGATAVYAPQKGADGAAVEELEAALRRFVAVATTDLPRAAGEENRAGAGAAGGLGYGLMLAGARPEPGIELVLRAAGFRRRLAGAGLVVTGEGRLDDQSLHGKVVAGVAAAAGLAGVPCLVVAGDVRLAARRAAAAGISATYAAADEAGSQARSLAEPHRYVAAAAARAASAWST